MTRGISVNVGLNKVTSSVFHATELDGCENDATAMRDIAVAQHFESATLLVGPMATLDSVVNAVKSAAGKLESGDLFLFTFAGHGTFKVVPASAEEVDKHDESIVLTDHLLIDNFWRNELWPKFKPGVRVIAVADCCHSGTVLVSDEQPSLEAVKGGGKRSGTQHQTKVKVRELADEERQKELAEFSQIYETQLAPAGKQINCTRIFLSACLDNQKASDGAKHGAFTKALLDVWANGGFTGNYNEFMDKIKVSFNNSSQTPNLTAFGSPDFSNQKPFTV